MTAVSEPDLDALARRVDAAVAALADLDPAARAAAEELRAALEDIHRVGLTTIVTRMRTDDAARPLLFDLVDDPVVRMLLTLHGIIRPDPVTLAQRALAAVRPQLNGHGGDVTLVEVADGVVSVRLDGACNGCSMSAVTLRELVETALREGVPGLVSVQVLPNEAPQTLIPVESLLSGRPRETDGWVKVAAAQDVPDDDFAVRGEVLVVHLAAKFAAFRNECAHEALPLDNAVLDLAGGTLTCPWHGFCYDAESGECLTAPGAQLEQLPLRVDDGDVWVRVAG